MKRTALPLVFLTVSWAGPALADDPYALNGVVVTGTRQESELRNLAGNTSVVDQSRIGQTAPERPSEILNQIPGVNIQQGSGEEHLTAIRSPVFNGGEGAGSFLYLEDGVPLRAAGFGNVNGLYEANVEQAGSVEVVRGPGSALYGSNAMYGLINVIPRAPSKTNEGELDVTMGSYGARILSGTVSGTEGDMAARLSAEDHHEGGWRDHTHLDEQKSILRSVWTGKEDTVTTTLSGQHLDQQTGDYITGLDSYKNHETAKTNLDPEAFRHADSFRAMSRWQHDLTDNLQLSLTPYMRDTDMAFIQHYLPDKALEKDQHASGGMQSALYASLPGGHSVIFGTDAEYTSGTTSEIQTLATIGTGAAAYTKGTHYDYSADSTVVAPYVHSEWQLAEATRMTAGIRLEDTEYDYTNNTTSGVFGRFLRVPSRSDHFDTVTPKFGLVQQWEDWLSSYANLSRGSRAPQVSELYSLQAHQIVGQIKPESIDNMELGSRGNFHGVKFDFDGYWMIKRDGFYRTSDGYNMTDAVTWHRGAELDLSAPLPGHFDIGASASYALHTYEFTQKTASAVSAVDIGQSVFKGGTVAEAPRTLANLRLGYTFAQGVRGEAEVVHVGPYYIDSADTLRYSGHELLNLRISAELTDSVTLHGKVLNVTNAAYADRATFSNNVVQYFPGDPLTFLGGVTVKF